MHMRLGLAPGCSRGGRVERGRGGSRAVVTRVGSALVLVPAHNLAAARVSTVVDIGVGMSLVVVSSLVAVSNLVAENIPADRWASVRTSHAGSDFDRTRADSDRTRGGTGS